MPLSAESLRLPESLTRDYLLHHRVCPLSRDGNTTLVAVGTVPFLGALVDIEGLFGGDVSTHTVSDEELDRLIELATTRSARDIEVARVESDSDLESDARDLATQPPVIRFVNLLVREAYEGGASDIHLEAARHGLVVRFRIDGVLAPAPEPETQLHHAVVSRLKLLADLDIAERRKPQDGRIRVRLDDRELDLRVSTVPTMYGESVVLRLLERGGRPVSLTGLGMAPSVLRQVEILARRPHGMLLVTGPTGSGKTTTLYAALQTRDAAAEKIITVEDPIEYRLPGITQMPVHRQAGVSFGSALRAILRQDPDVVMIGEMRDKETAEIAVQAAMTGHLVFSTLHTNDAVSAIPRLLDLGVPEYLAAATLEGVLAQRLVRRICSECQTRYEPPADQVAAIAGRPVGTMALTRGLGCSHCRGTGFRGRLGIFELLLVTDDVRDAITRRASRNDLRALAERGEMMTLRADGWTKVQAGLTTIEEVLRVAHD